MKTTDESRTDWERLKRMRDDEIDFSDIPELGDDFFRNAIIVMPKDKCVVQHPVNLLKCDEK